MTNVKEKTDEKKEQLEKLINSSFPNLSSPELVKAALDFENALK